MTRSQHFFTGRGRTGSDGGPMARGGRLSGDVGLMILCPFDGEDEDAGELSEESGEDKEIPAISSCFRSACTLSGNNARTHPIPRNVCQCSPLTHNPNASFARTRLLALTRPLHPNASSFLQHVLVISSLSSSSVCTIG